MYFSLNQINKYLKVKKLTHTEVEVALNELGFEVEQVKRFSDIEGLVFAKVLEVKDNPNAPKLDLLTLETKNGIINIQTNNKILKPGDLSICFPVGSRNKDIVYGEKMLQGYPSQGMMAALSEIGYDYELLEAKDQVLVLPSDFATLNDNPIVKLGLDDYIIEVSTTANRNDANSYYVLARELAAYFDLEFNFEITKVKDSFKSNLVVENKLASELSFTEVHGSLETSFEEKLLLAKHGISSRFNWAVNLSNLCLILMGTPTHVYDLNKIGSKISTQLYSGKVNILGNKEVEVKDVLAICDEHKVISLACVMGLEDTKADENSSKFVFEIGLFDPKLVRHGAKEIKLLTNSSNQGSRVISQEMVALGMNFIRSYCKDLQVSNTVNEVNVAKPLEIKLNDELLTRYAYEYDQTKYKNALAALTKLGFEFKKDKVKVPNYRYDVTIFEDIIEEIFRFMSYSQFKAQPYKNKPVLTQKRNNDKAILVHQGYFEARTFTLVSEQKAKLNPFNFASSVKLQTFVSKEREVVRNSIISSLSEVIDYNQKRKINNLNIFEHGMINNNVLVYGMASTVKDFTQVQEDLLNFLQINDLEFVPFKDNEYIHQNYSAKIMHENKMIGWIGKLHPKFNTTNAVYAEFIKPNVLKQTKFTPVDFSPLKSVDLTFEIQNGDYIGKIVQEIKQTVNVLQVQQIDDYQKQNSHNITLRITANEANIALISKKYNK
ncbi:phenylalanine--tRNA ligase subunit beta [Mycoplasma corogypsi]|uniref:phenylalanine--tRNA ligase subunit beta n=1 Tax=Mycoplasma corogypsi TaxID=2106 RepID=UPI00387369B4